MSEKEVRELVADEITVSLKDVMDNCICLGRDAYGAYVDKMVLMIQNQIRNGRN
jgi:hypothetical protein